MQIEHVLVNDIIPYKNNAKEHPKHQIEQIVRSVREFGFNDPIAIDENNVIIEGHGRLEALKLMGINSVDCIRLSHLTEEQKRAYIIAHNKLTMNTGFNMDIILGELEFLTSNDFDTTLTGFDTDELADILHEDKEVVDDDFDIILPEEPKSKFNDLWILGEHRVICGDSTQSEAYEKLLENEIIDLVVTDPPYNVDYGSKAEAINKYGYQFSDRHIENDYMPELQFIDFLTDAFENMKNSMKEGAAFYIFHASVTLFEFELALRNNNLKSRQQLIWNKNSIVLGRQDYQWKHEPCLYGWKEGAAHYFVDDRTNTTVFEDDKIDIKKLKKNELLEIVEQMYADKISTTIINEDKPSKSSEHPTMKPIKLLARLIKNSSKIGQKVLDNFGGSGSTLITCEQLGRQAFSIELDPRFIDVIVNRFANYNTKYGNNKPIKLIRDGHEYTYAEIMEDV